MFRKQHDANSAALGKYFQVGDTNESFAYSFIEEGSGTYVGKPSLNFLQTKFTIYDGQTPHKGTKTTKSRSVKCENLNQVFTQGFYCSKRNSVYWVKESCLLYNQESLSHTFLLLIVGVYGSVSSLGCWADSRPLLRCCWRQC
ncbi:hypothetical protein K1719_011864 [Acacia pycnantha]|nr:hypothetical protein K1719_011864 [Acacia pycnantha]